MIAGTRHTTVEKLLIAESNKGFGMRGGQVFMESLLLHGVDGKLGNPGTTEN